MTGSAFSVITLILTLGIGTSWIANAHEKHQHTTHANPNQKAAQPNTAGTFKRIDDAYSLRVRPIFEKSCFDCHSSNTRYPWYFRLPGVKQLIESDTQEARKHLDMTSGFPFQGHGTPIEDLEAIQKSIREGTMPPMRYWLLHWSSRLNGSEKQVVDQWTEESLKALK